MSPKANRLRAYLPHQAVQRLGSTAGGTVGAATADLVGEVHSLKNVKDIEGTYSAAQTAIAVG